MERSAGCRSSATKARGTTSSTQCSAMFVGPGRQLFMIVRRVEALGRFLDTEDGANLLAGYRRAANILRIEEKKDGRAYNEAPDLRLVDEPGRARGEGFCGRDLQGFAAISRRRRRRRISRVPCARSRASRAGRCVLRQGDGQCGRSGAPRQPFAAPQRHPRDDAQRRRLLAHHGMSRTIPAPVAREAQPRGTSGSRQA